METGEEFWEPVETRLIASLRTINNQRPTTNIRQLLDNKFE
jgi:hypothetical protein